MALSEVPVYASIQPAVRHILRKMQSRQPEKLSGALGVLSASLDRTGTASPASLSVEDKEKKKQDALARQARVMAQMKQQQNSFLVNQGLAGFDDEDFALTARSFLDAIDSLEERGLDVDDVDVGYLLRRSFELSDLD